MLAMFPLSDHSPQFNTTLNLYLYQPLPPLAHSFSHPIYLTPPPPQYDLCIGSVHDHHTYTPPHPFPCSSLWFQSYHVLSIYPVVYMITTPTPLPIPCLIQSFVPVLPMFYLSIQ